jgi:hypothetical protein
MTIQKFKLINTRLLFKPSNTLDWQQKFAQIPIGYIRGNVLDVVFATRSVVDRFDNYRSYPAMVSFQLPNFQLMSICDSPLLDLGSPGSFDDSGIMPGSIIELSGNTQAMYYCGWSLSSPTPYKWSIGIAYAEKGQAFCRRYNGPIISSSIQNPFLVASPIVSRPNQNVDYFEMYHLSGTSWNFIDNNWESRYLLSKSVSLDGVNWNKSEFHLNQVRWDDECQTSPNFFTMHGERYLSFSYRSQSGFRKDLERNYKTAIASQKSQDTWSVIQSELSISGTDVSRSDIAYMTTFNYHGELYALFNFSEGFGTSGIYIGELVSGS